MRGGRQISRFKTVPVPREERKNRVWRRDLRSVCPTKSAAAAGLLQPDSIPFLAGRVGEASPKNGEVDGGLVLRFFNPWTDARDGLPSLVFFKSTRTTRQIPTAPSVVDTTSVVRDLEFVCYDERDGRRGPPPTGIDEDECCFRSEEAVGERRKPGDLAPHE